LKFKKPVKLEDKLTVTCQVYQNVDKPSRFSFKQTILVNDKVHAEADFSATCILPTGRPGVPDEVKRIFESQE
jgi:acyl-CoA thioester hydrolase